MAKNLPAMANTVCGIGWSSSQAQGKMVSPTAIMERAADHLEHNSLVFASKVVVLTFYPTTPVPQWTASQQGTLEQLISKVLA